MNTRKDNEGRALKEWISMRPGLIQKPLRHILNRVGPRDGLYLGALSASKNGDGHWVQTIAHRLRW